MGLLSHSEKKTQSKTVTPDLIFKSGFVPHERSDDLYQKMGIRGEFYG